MLLWNLYIPSLKWNGGDLLVNKIYLFVIWDFSWVVFRSSTVSLNIPMHITMCFEDCFGHHIVKYDGYLCTLDFVGGDLKIRLMIKILASLEDCNKLRNLCCSRFRGNWMQQADLWQRSCLRACNFPSKLGMIWWAWRTRWLTLND